MQRFILLAVFFLTLFLSSQIRVNAQNEKVQFTAKWKQNTDTAIIIVTFTKGNGPFTLCLYDDSPFKGGKLISKKDNISESTFEVNIEKRQKVYLCVLKDDNNYTIKLLDVTE